MCLLKHVFKHACLLKHACLPKHAVKLKHGTNDGV
jgi:hypothetical protein